MANRYQFTAGKRNKILQKLDSRCAYCGEQLSTATMTIDHVKPLSGNGTNKLSNLVPSCMDCNLFKNSMRMSTFRKRIWELLRIKKDTLWYYNPLRIRMLEKYEPVFYCQDFKEVVFYNETLEETND